MAALNMFQLATHFAIEFDLRTMSTGRATPPVVVDVESASGQPKRFKQAKIDQLFTQKTPKSTGRPVIKNRAPRSAQHYQPVVTAVTSSSKLSTGHFAARPRSTEPVVSPCQSTPSTSKLSSPRAHLARKRKLAVTLTRRQSLSESELPTASTATIEKPPPSSVSSDKPSTPKQNGADKPSKNAEEVPSVKMQRIEDLFDRIDDFSPANDESERPLVPDATHTVMFASGAADDRPPPPFPGSYIDVWDDQHVRLPCSPRNLLAQGDTLVSRWDLIRKALASAPAWNSVQDFQNAIISYSGPSARKWSFKGLQAFVDALSDRERSIFFGETLARMAQLALQLPQLCTQGIPLLRQGRPHRVTLSQQQLACLLAHCFFCTFPSRNSHRQGGVMDNFPRINFTTLFSAGRDIKVEKLRTLVHYFQRVTKKMPTGAVTFERCVRTAFPNWSQSGSRFGDACRLYVSATGTIEDDGANMLQMDFANKFLGGGVLNQGCVQEEIRFLCSPELIVSALFTECLADNEAVLITGAERFSAYAGYAGTFEWAGAYTDAQPVDGWRRRRTRVLAVDATCYGRSTNRQYGKAQMLREMNKLHAGVSRRTYPRVLATGNWGCGAFGGDRRLKALLQLLVACENEHHVAYFTFDDDGEFDGQLRDIHAFLVDNRVTIGQLFSTLVALAASTSVRDSRQLYASVRARLSADGGGPPAVPLTADASPSSSSDSAEPELLAKSDENVEEHDEDDEVPDTPPPAAAAAEDTSPKESVFDALNRLEDPN